MYDPYNPLHEPIPKVPFHQTGLSGYGYFGEDRSNQYDWECPPDAICAAPETKPSFPVQDSKGYQPSLASNMMYRIRMGATFAVPPAAIGFVVAKAMNKNPLPYTLGGVALGLVALVGIIPRGYWRL